MEVNKTHRYCRTPYGFHEPVPTGNSGFQWPKQVANLRVANKSGKLATRNKPHQI